VLFAVITVAVAFIGPRGTPEVGGKQQNAVILAVKRLRAKQVQKWNLWPFAISQDCFYLGKP
jgi:hypothetical protein